MLLPPSCISIFESFQFICKVRADHPRPATYFDELRSPPEVTELYAGRAEYFAWLRGCCSWPDKERLGFQSTDRKSRGTMNAIAFNFNTITISDGTVQFFQVARDVETFQQSRAQNHCLQHAAARKSQLINLV